MNMAKEQMKARALAFCKRWFALPALAVVAAVVGTVVGALTAFFGDVLLRVGELREANPLYFIPLLAAAGAGIVFAYKKWGKGSDRGMGLVFSVAHKKEDHIPLRLIPFVAVCTWVTHLFGGSAGREGVAMQIGAAFGHNVSKKLPFENASHIMLVAGMAAGFAGLFQTPMAATAFALEVLIVGHLELAALLPAAVAAFTACKISQMLGLEKFSVDLDELLASNDAVVSLFEIDGSLDVNFALKLAILGVVFGIVGGAFTKVLSFSKNFFAKKMSNPIKRILIMGASLSVVFLVLFQGRYSGLGTNLIDICFGSVGASGIHSYDWMLKFALTILTLSAGFVGGEVTPLFAIGATLGMASASLLGLPLPLAAALGYASVFGSASNTLFAPILIGVEVFGFQSLPLFAIVCTVAYVCNGGGSIYNQRKIRLK
ncbi:MAG: chloride channel protein [Fibrobacteraceae bacterium]|nr:chloride channel protein [Fibrobacteraceae bacterium]